MKYKQFILSCAWLVAGLALAGCEHLYYADPNPTQPYVFPGQPATASAGSPAKSYQGSTSTPSSPVAPSTPVPPLTPVVATQPPVSAQANVGLPTTPGAVDSALSSSILQKGDLVTVTFTDVPPNTMPEHKQRIQDDGNITLPLNVVVHAAGKTAYKLQEDIRAQYVPRYFVRLTVTVKSEDRYYYVGGEVRVANRQVYLGDMTVLRAIDTAGGFTDFASRKNIEVRRANGKKYKVNWNDALKDPSKDLPVYPNDQIIVHKKAF